MRDVITREEYPDGGTRETLACGHVVYLTKSSETAMRRCLLCIRSTRRPPHAQQHKRP
jgi:hypothetical protein